MLEQFHRKSSVAPLAAQQNEIISTWKLFTTLSQQFSCCRARATFPSLFPSFIRCSFLRSTRTPIESRTAAAADDDEFLANQEKQECLLFVCIHQETLNCSANFPLVFRGMSRKCSSENEDWIPSPPVLWLFREHIFQLFHYLLAFPLILCRFPLPGVQFFQSFHSTQFLLKFEV